MPDNGFGAQGELAGLPDPGVLRPARLQDRQRRHGDVAVGDFIQFSDPDGMIGFPIVNEGTADRLLTGGDIDPESLQRGTNGDLWMGDEFGPWILHFDATGVLLDPPYATRLARCPAGCMSPNNPHLGGSRATQPNSRGFEAMAITPNGKYLYAVAGGRRPSPTRTRCAPRLRVQHRRTGVHRPDVVVPHRGQPGHFVADMRALDHDRLVRDRA